MDKSNRLAGVLMLAFSALGAWFIVRSLVRALSNGYSPGKLGAIHQAGSIQYFAFVAGCFVGIGLVVVLGIFGLRSARLIGTARK
jgi:hypothetical protein